MPPGVVARAILVLTDNGDVQIQCETPNLVIALGMIEKAKFKLFVRAEALEAQQREAVVETPTPAQVKLLVPDD